MTENNSPRERAGFAAARRMIRAGVAFVALGGGGCLSWDTVTSNSFWDDPIAVTFHNPEPIDVLRSPESTGDELAKAMSRLREPARSGGGRAEQDEVMEILTRFATTDDRALCRIAAIEALGRFEDPRAAAGVVAAYQVVGPVASVKSRSDGEGELRFTKLAGLSEAEEAIEPLFDDFDAGPFPPEVVTAIRCRAIDAMGRGRSPVALPILIAAANPPRGRDDGAAGDDLSPTQEREIRLAAIRSLGNYPSERRAAEPLVRVLREESDISLRERAQQGLVSITGQELPPNADSWAAVLPRPAGEPGIRPTTAPPPAGEIRQVGRQVPASPYGASR